MENIKSYYGVWLPETDEHITQRFAVREGWQYQKQKLDEAMKYVTDRRACLDIGAHCGLWSKNLVHEFGMVYAFEPIPIHWECFIRNVPQPNAVLYRYAVGDKDCVVNLAYKPSSTGDTRVAEEGIPAQMKTIDEFNFQDIGFMKWDIECYEYFGLIGAEKTIERCRPVMIVEAKPDKGHWYGISDTEAITWLRKRNYEIVDVIAGDYIMVPK